MASPSTSLATLRPDLAGSLEQFDLAMDRQGFIGQRILPIKDVAKSAGKFGQIPLAQLLQNRETARASGSGYSRGSFTFTDDSFATGEHGAEEPVDDREAELYSDYFDAEQVSTQRAFDVVLRNQEKRISALIFNTTTWTGAPLTTAITTPWSTIATAIPIDDVQNAAKKLWDGSGLMANALIMTWKTWWNLRRCAQIVDLVKYSGLMDPRSGNVTTQAIAQVLDIPNIIVAGSAKNSANEGQAVTIASVWDDDMAMVARLAQTDDIREPCLGRIFHWGEDGSQPGGTVESYRDETIRGDVIRVRHDIHEKVLYKQMGHLLTNTI